MIFVGIDWSEQHHDIEIQDAAGGVLATARIADGVDGIGRLHALVGDHAADPAAVIVGIEIDRGLLVGSLVAGQPLGRHPPRLPTPPRRLRRSHRMGPPRRATRQSSLTS